MTRTIALSAAIALFSGAAMADPIELTRPLQAGSLHDGGIDMVVYYDAADTDRFEVVAAYAARTAPHEAYRVRLGLAEGEGTAFSLPGERHISYRFRREGDTVHVSTTPTPRKTAELTAPWTPDQN